MQTFIDFLTEEKSSGPGHVHDLAIGHGNDGVGKAGAILDAVHKKLLGKHSAISITTEKSQPDNKDPVLKPKAANYTPNEQRRYLDHVEGAKRVFSQMKPDSMDIIGKHGHHLRDHLSKLSRNTEPPKTDGYLDYLTKKADKNVDRTNHSVGEDEKRHGYSNAIAHVQANRPHYDKALELHHFLGRARDVLTHVIGKNYKQAGHRMGSEGAVATGRAGIAKFARNSK